MEKKDPVKEVAVPNLPPPELLDRLPDEVRTAVIQSAYSGPLPPPPMYSEYEAVLPGSADRILAMAEKEQAIRHEWEGRAQRLSARGQWLGFIIALACVGGAVLLGLTGHEWIAAVFAGFASINLVSRFLGRSSN